MLQGLYKGQEVSRELPLSLCLRVCMCSVYNYSVLCIMCNHVTFISSHVLFPMCSWQVTTPVT